MVQLDEFQIYWRLWVDTLSVMKDIVTNEDDMKAVFKIFERDQNGYINRQEIRDFLMFTKLIKQDPSVNDFPKLCTETNEALNHAGILEQTKIDFSEFVNYVNVFIDYPNHIKLHFNKSNK